MEAGVQLPGLPVAVLVSVAVVAVPARPRRQSRRVDLALVDALQVALLDAAHRGLVDGVAEALAVEARHLAVVADLERGEGDLPSPRLR